MNDNPNLITESGREHLPDTERRILLGNAAIELAASGPKWKPGSTRTHQIDCHDWNQFLGMLQGASKPGTWGIAWQSRLECMIMAWRRGGVDEWRRVREIQRVTPIGEAARAIDKVGGMIADNLALAYRPEGLS